MRVLHLSADFPDPFAPAKTRAISNLLGITPGISHSVYSLNRVSGAGCIRVRNFGERWRALRYGAPPKGLLHRHYLHRLADWICRDIDRRDLAIDMVHAHKLSVEGVAGEIVASRLGVPMVTSVQGNTDGKIVAWKPGLRRDFRRLWHRAAVTFPFAPWAADRMGDLLGARTGPTFALPCPTSADRLIAPRLVGPLIRTAFRLEDWRNKNIAMLLAGLARAAEDIPNLKLEIAGEGPDHARAAIGRLARKAGVADRVTLVGPVPHAEMQTFLNGAAAFALVSRRESYGMVFAEALLSGTPALHSTQSGCAG